MGLAASIRRERHSKWRRDERMRKKIANANEHERKKWHEVRRKVAHQRHVIHHRERHAKHEFHHKIRERYHKQRRKYATGITMTAHRSRIKPRHGNKCLDASQRNHNGGRIWMYHCNWSNHNQQWNFDSSTGLIRNSHGLCMRLLIGTTLVPESTPTDAIDMIGISAGT